MVPLSKKVSKYGTPKPSKSVQFLEASARTPGQFSQSWRLSPGSAESVELGPLVRGARVFFWGLGVRGLGFRVQVEEFRV